MSEDLPSKQAVHFEAVKVALSQSKDGHKLVLAVHPDDLPEDLFRSLVGQRYMIAAVALDDNDQPIPKRERQAPTDPDKDVAYAARLCKEPAFQRWMYNKGHCRKPDEESTAAGLRTLLGVSSRSELRSSEEARRVLHEVAQRYLDGR